MIDEWMANVRKLLAMALSYLCNLLQAFAQNKLINNSFLGKFDSS